MNFQLQFAIPFLAALIFIIFKYVFFNEESNFNDLMIELIFLTIINYTSFYIVYENFKPRETKQVKLNTDNSIITGPPKFFPYQKV